ncbi:thiopeptide maturation pyridine synthase [Kutzneria buriramensis]|uniref:Lantibiotic biosynthesis dehydratase-like protein n=1 Tax=Kutzneria buriramensis TaxID=1045776 RepID=A0A3E0H5H2_9PSEU|nr:thiopeptide maturation pyridine synthase [Kutzneria buriramensis]REH38064.1 lantibiotic biosynthesis dehydratase-like protein [Kutzneria buriramensis]
MRWRSVHVYHYDDDKTDLVLDAVRPVFRELPAGVRAYYVPHWLKGPHLRLNFEADQRLYDDVVLPAVFEVVGGYLRDRPSTAVVDPQQLHAQHKRLAELEQERGELSPLRPDNSIHEADYDQRLHVLGTTAAADLLADFYVDTTPLAFDMTEAVRNGRQLLRLGFDLMVASAHALSGIGFARGFVSFRSHSEAFLSWMPEGEGLRPAWQRHYEQHADALTGRVQAVLATIDTAGPCVPFVRPWVDVMMPYWQRGAELIEADQLRMLAGPRPDSAEYAERMRRSPLHRARKDVVVDPVWFAKFRLMLNYTYLHLTRLGLAPAERFLLCHLAANAAEDLFGRSAAEVTLPAPGDGPDPRELVLRGAR